MTTPMPTSISRHSNTQAAVESQITEILRLQHKAAEDRATGDKYRQRSAELDEEMQAIKFDDRGIMAYETLTELLDRASESKVRAQIDDVIPWSLTS